MKKVALICSFLVWYAAAGAQAPLHVMTFNVRYNNPGDSLNAWPYRKANAASQILFHEVHLLGVQEALHGQMEDLKTALPRYKYFGVGRTDGKTAGEYSAIFWIQHACNGKKAPRSGWPSTRTALA